jgi:hypothetical protein
VPDEAMKLHMSLWAPGSEWSAAYDAAFAPTAQAAQAQTCAFDVDHVRVERLVSGPGARSLLLFGPEDTPPVRR